MRKHEPTPVELAAGDLTRGMADARRLMTQPDQAAMTVISNAVAADSQPPWNQSAANAYLDPHEGVRRLETSLQVQVTGRPPVMRRGPSEESTAAALSKIVAFAGDVGRDDAKLVTRILLRWVNAAQCLAAVDERVRWVPICPGRDGPRCPYCETLQLRVAEDRGLVMCFYPGCEDGNGRTPLARLGLSPVNGDPELAWDDGRRTKGTA